MSAPVTRSFHTPQKDATNRLVGRANDWLKSAGFWVAVSASFFATLRATEARHGSECFGRKRVREGTLREQRT